MTRGHDTNDTGMNHHCFTVFRRGLIAALAAGAFLASAQAHPSSPAVDDAKARAEVTAYYGQVRQAVAQRDAAALRALYSDRFTHTHGSGKVDGRDARVVSLLADDPTVEMRTDHELVVDTYDGDVAIVRGKGPVLNVKENQLYQFRWVQVLLKRDGRWEMAVSQATRLPDAPLPAPARN